MIDAIVTKSGGTTIVAAVIADSEEVGLLPDSWGMLRIGWTCALLSGTSYRLDGDEHRAQDAFDLYFGEV